jgi:membrane-anchored protein YejM (alkaline phosphatase superfamily)
MKSKPSFVRVLILLGVLFFQLVMTQVITFVLSLLIGGLENVQQSNKYLFAAIIGLTFSIGAFFSGWVALRLRWLEASPRLPARAIGTLLGAYIPLLAAVLIYPVFEPGNPFYSLSILGAIIGFHVPTWIKAG